MFAKFSPDGSRVAYVRANNIYVERLETGTVTPLTRDGSTTTINGTSDWVYEEELDVRDGFRWSPDGQRIAYWQFDSTGVEMFTLINDTAALYPAITRIPYPKAGTTNSAVRIGVVSAGGGADTWMNMPGDPRDNYLARLDWLDRDTVAIQQLNRLQNQDDFYLADATTGAATRVFRDTSKTWVDVVDDVRWTERNRRRVSCGSASGTAGGTCIACLAAAAREPRSRASTPTSSTSWAPTMRMDGCTSSRRRPTRPSAICIDRSSTGPVLRNA